MTKTESPLQTAARYAWALTLAAACALPAAWLAAAAMLAIPREALADEAGARKVKITWRAIESAAKYDFELSAKPEMDPLLDRKDYTANEISLKLKAGTYFFRVRGIDRSDAPGPWSEVQGFVVNQAAPTQLEPEPDTVFKTRSSDGTIELKWKQGLHGTKYLLEISDAKGAVVKRSVDGTSVRWTPGEAGAYRWRVGFETPTGDEWGKYRSFTVEKSFLPGPKVIEKTVEKIVVKHDAVEIGDEVDEEGGAAEDRPAEWWLIGRLAQSVVAYSAQDNDTGVNGSGAALVGLFSAELRWRQATKAGQIWTWSGAANFEMIRQIVLGTEFDMPRGYGRVFYGRNYGRWKLAPFLQFGAGQSGIFVVQSATTARQGKVFRENIGVGGAAVYRPSSGLLLSGLLTLRRDMGGNMDSLPNPLDSSMAFEAGFGVSVGLGSKLMVEGRLRALQETLSWQPAKAGAGASSLTNLFLILDAGVGWRF